MLNTETNESFVKNLPLSTFSSFTVTKKQSFKLFVKVDDTFLAKSYVKIAHLGITEPQICF